MSNNTSYLTKDTNLKVTLHLQIRIPKPPKWIAQDRAGVFYGFMEKPYKIAEGWTTKTIDLTTSKYQGTGVDNPHWATPLGCIEECPNPEWEKSLMEVSEGKLIHPYESARWAMNNKGEVTLHLQIPLPDTIKWGAPDKEGGFYGFSREPYIRSYLKGEEWSRSDLDWNPVWHLGSILTEPNENWRESLMSVASIHEITK